MGGLWREGRGHIRMSRGLGPSAPPGAPCEAGTSKSCLPGLATRGAGGAHLSPWPVEAGRATQLCLEQMNRGGREVRTRRTRPPPAPRKALAAGGAWCGRAWCGMAGRHGPADEEGREAQQGARARAPHANMVSCNHCQAERGWREGSARAETPSLASQLHGSGVAISSPP